MAFLRDKAELSSESDDGETEEDLAKSVVVDCFIRDLSCGIYGTIGFAVLVWAVSKVAVFMVMGRIVFLDKRNDNSLLLR